MPDSPRTTHIALLRGINVGTAKRVAMSDLRAVLEGLGYGGVKTLLNSGNLLFAARAIDKRDHGARIEKAIAQKTGVTSRVTVLTTAELGAIVDSNPLATPGRDPSRLLVAVVKDPLDLSKARALLKLDWAPESLAVGRRAAYLWIPEGLMESVLAKAMAKALGDGATTRNWATITKLHALVVAETTAGARP
jgi:uncharacterized protein (DUF1697 family)